jgi:hypothetical protein
VHEAFDPSAFLESLPAGCRQTKTFANAPGNKPLQADLKNEILNVIKLHVIELHPFEGH